MPKRDKLNHYRSNSEQIIGIIQLTDFGVPVEIVAALVELVARELTVAYAEGAVDAGHEFLALIDKHHPRPPS